MTGKHHSLKSRKKMSLSHIGKPNSFKGKHHTKEAKLKMSLFRKGKLPWISGKKHTEEAKKKMSLAKIGRIGWNKGKSLTKEHKHNISFAKKGVPNPKISNILKGRHLPDKVKAKISLSNLITKKRKEHTKAITKEADNFRKQGFKVFISDNVRPDLIVRKGDHLYAVEVEFGLPENSKMSKYDGQKLFDDIYWIVYD